MRNGDKLLFATYLKNEELEELKGFLAEITALIKKHYHFTHDVEFKEIQDVTRDDLRGMDWTYFVLSSRLPATVQRSVELEVMEYRALKGDALISYASDGAIGKHFKSAMNVYRSLEEYTSMEALKLQLYYELCVKTDIGGLSIVSPCHNGKACICGEELKTLDASAVPVFAGDAENAAVTEKMRSSGERYEALKAQYAERKGDTEFIKEYVDADKKNTVAKTTMDLRETCISEIMTMTAELRKCGAVCDDYRIAYTLFLRGDYGKAYSSLVKARSYGTAEYAYGGYLKFLNAVDFLRMRLLSLLPEGFTVPGRKNPVDAKTEWEETVIGLSHEKYRDCCPALSYYALAHYANLWDGACHRSSYYRDNVKKHLDALKKEPGDNRYEIYRLSMMLANYYLDKEDFRTTKLYLDRSLSLIQDLSKDFGGLYDLYVGDTYITYSVHFRNRHMFDEMQDNLFSAADRYKSAHASEPDNPEIAKRLGHTYRTLARNYALSGSPDYARDYLAKAAENFEKGLETDRADALKNIAEMYEDFAEIVKPENGVKDVSEAEDYLLRALKAYKELASIKPHEYKVLPGLMYDKLGSVFRDAGEYDEGMDYFRSAEAEYRQDIEILSDIYNPLLAKCYVTMFADPQPKDQPEAIEKLKWAVDTFVKAADSDPGFYMPEAAGAWRALGRAQRLHGDTEDAIASHISAMNLFDRCEEAADDSVCYVSDLACELAEIGELYDAGKADDEEKRTHAEEFHLQAIGTAYCADIIRLPDMGNTLRNVTTSYILSLLHPGFSALIALLSRYVTGTEYDSYGEANEDLAEKVADYSDTKPDMTAEDDYVLSQMLEAMDRSKKKAKEDSDANLFLLGAYHAISVQYDSMGRDKESKKYSRKARKLFNDEFAPREEDLENWDDYGNDSDGDITPERLEELRNSLTPEILEALSQIFGMTEDEIMDVLGGPLPADGSAAADNEDEDEDEDGYADIDDYDWNDEDDDEDADDEFWYNDEDDDEDGDEWDDDPLGIDFAGGAGGIDFGDEPDDGSLMELLKELFPEKDSSYPADATDSADDAGRSRKSSAKEDKDSVERFIRSLEKDPNPDGNSGGDLS